MPPSPSPRSLNNGASRSPTGTHDRDTAIDVAAGLRTPLSPSTEDSENLVEARYYQAEAPTNVKENLISNGDEEEMKHNSTDDGVAAIHKSGRWRRFITPSVAVLLVVTAVAISLYFVLRHRSSSPSTSLVTSVCHNPDIDSCTLLCSGILLQTIQFSGLFNDSKTFVDMPMNKDPGCVQHDFDTMQDYSKQSLYDFVQRNFEQSCTDMLPWRPDDYDESPPLLENIVDITLRNWTSDVNALWTLLGRQLSPDVYDNPHRHTLMPLRSPHMIVPGGRFCEFYYWDTYWIIRGLLVSNMTETARNIVNNFIGLVQDYGFVPNGSRKYYLNRSQPPMLTLMVREVFDVTQDLDWLQDLLDTLESEYAYWMQRDTRAVLVTDKQGVNHTLNRYYSNSTIPRPEGYVQDSMTAWLLYNWTVKEEERTKHQAKHMSGLNFAKIPLKNMQDAHMYQMSDDFADLLHYEAPHAPSRSSQAVPPPPPIPNFSNLTQIQNLFGELTAGAESGWDFSSRWFHDRSNLTSVETMNIVPVDLNAILYKVEVELAAFYQLFKNQIKVDQYTAASQARLAAIDAILWNVASSQWQDYHLDQQTWKSEVMLSNFVPLWTKCYDKAVVDEASVISALLQSGLVMDGGIVTTLNNNTQQWDFPNAWAPLQWMVIEGIESSEYDSISTMDTFTIYNSSALPHGEPSPNPALSCDIIHPDTWYNCSASTHSCSWCFPQPKEMSRALSLRWLYSNYLAYNSTGFMLEKYYAPQLGSPGAGGEYQLQKGFGWTNGVVLDWMNKLSNQTKYLNIKHLSTQSFPYSKMAAFVDLSPILPPHPPTFISSHPIAKTAQTMKEEMRKEMREEREREQERQRQRERMMKSAKHIDTIDRS